MREILGYAPVEPDGSVRSRYPPTSPSRSTCSMPTAGASRRCTTNWLQVLPGETVTCNGCHTPASRAASPLSHGRAGLFPLVNTGATATGGLSRTRVASFVPECRARPWPRRAPARAAQADTPPCMQMVPSVNVVYQDVWTNPAVRAPGCELSLQLSRPEHHDQRADLERCVTTAGRTCAASRSTTRSTIQPLWDKLRQVTDPTTGAVIGGSHLHAGRLPQREERQPDAADTRRASSI